MFGAKAKKSLSFFSTTNRMIDCFYILILSFDSINLTYGFDMLICESSMNLVLDLQFLYFDLQILGFGSKQLQNDLQFLQFHRTHFWSENLIFAIFFDPTPRITKISKTNFSKKI